MSVPLFLNKDTLASCILIGIFVLVGVVGNALMLRSLIKYKQLRIDVYVIFGGLAIADIIHLVFAGPAKIINTFPSVEVSTDAWCKASQFLSTATGYAASYHIVLLSVLRGIVLTYRGRPPPTPQQALISSVICWIITLLGSIPVFFTFEKIEYSLLCDVASTESLITTIWLNSAFTFFLPLLLIVCIYGLTHYVSKRYFADSYSGHARKMSRLINSIVIAFVICQFPYHVVNLHLFYTQKRMSEMTTISIYDEDRVVTLFTILDYLYCLVLAGKCIRPVLYAKLADDLGESFDEVINCTICSKYYHTGEAVKRSKTRKRIRTRNSSANSQAPLTGAEYAKDERDIENEGADEVIVSQEVG